MVERTKLQHKENENTVPALGDHPGTFCNAQACLIFDHFGCENPHHIPLQRSVLYVAKLKVRLWDNIQFNHYLLLWFSSRIIILIC